MIEALLQYWKPLSILIGLIVAVWIAIRYKIPLLFNRLKILEDSTGDFMTREDCKTNHESLNKTVDGIYDRLDKMDKKRDAAREKDQDKFESVAKSIGTIEGLIKGLASKNGISI